jgi:hypothetical protein
MGTRCPVRRNRFAEMTETRLIVIALATVFLGFVIGYWIGR